MGDIWLFPLFTPLMNKNMKVAAVCLTGEHPAPRESSCCQHGRGEGTEKLQPALWEAAAVQKKAPSAPCTGNPWAFGAWAVLFPENAILRSKKIRHFRISDWPELNPGRCSGFGEAVGRGSQEPTARHWDLRSISLVSSILISSVLASTSVGVGSCSSLQASWQDPFCNFSLLKKKWWRLPNARKKITIILKGKVESRRRVPCVLCKAELSVAAAVVSSKALFCVKAASCLVIWSISMRGCCMFAGYAEFLIKANAVVPALGEALRN